MELYSADSWYWWAKKRFQYNVSLVVAGIVGFVFHAIALSCAPDNVMPEAELTILSIFAQSIAYLIFMGIANLCYFLGPWVDGRFNRGNSDHFRALLFRAGLIFSCCWPLLPAAAVLIEWWRLSRT